MKQKNIIKEVIQACLDKDTEKLNELKKIEFAKIFKRKEAGSPTTQKNGDYGRGCCNGFLSGL